MEIQEKDFEELERIRESYYELIMTVENKYPNESRHQTALRLIREAQQPSQPANAADAGVCTREYGECILKNVGECGNGCMYYRTA